ncbi:high affinity nitrate transporter NrtB [Amanita muscaria]
MVAFLAWYSIPPIMPHIAADLKISAIDVNNSNVIAVSATVLARIVVGPLCERFGPRRVMAGLLFAGSIPCAMTGLVKNASGLFGLRFMIGILGATFIPSQFWATQMFAPSVVGTANAFTGGWGNMGAGVTYLIMPAIHDGIRRYLPESKAWRVAFVIPAGICILAALAVLLLATDTPQGDWFRRQTQTLTNPVSITTEKDISVAKDGIAGLQDDDDDDETIAEVKRDEPPLVALASWFKVFVKLPVLIMVCAYACSFGVELAIDNVIGQVFQVKFKLDASKAAYIGSIFGLLNICSRLSGGLFSDFMAHRLHMPGRILALLSAMMLQGAFLIGFSFGLVTLSTSIVLMVFFSFFVQHVCGSTFAIVPFIDPVNNGKVMGIVGASGSLGGLIFNLMFRALGSQYDRAFLCLGCISLGVAIIGCLLLRVQNKTIWHLFHKRYS